MGLITGYSLRFRKPFQIERQGHTHVLTDITDRRRARFAHYYDTTGGLDIPASATTVPLDTKQNDTGPADFTLSSGELIVLEDGDYIIMGQVGLDTTSGTARTQSEAWLEVNGSEQAGTRMGMYNRTLNAGFSTGAFTTILKLAAGATLRLRAIRQAGAGPINTFADGSRLSVVEILG